MPLEDIVRAIEDDAQAERSHVIAAAEREIATIARRAEDDAARIREEVARGRSEVDRIDVRQTLLRAQAGAGREMRTAREHAYMRALKRARRRLAEIRTSSRYALVLRALIDEALKALPDAETVHVDPRDAAIVEAFLGYCRHDVSLVCDIETWGGAVVASSDGRTVRNTIEVRLDRADPYLRPIVAAAIPGMAPWESERDA